MVESEYGRLQCKIVTRRTSICKIACMLQCGTSFLTIAQYRLSRRQLKREMIWQNPSFHRFSSGCASCCNWRTRQAVRPYYEGFPRTDLILWCLTWWQAYPIRCTTPTHLTYQSSGLDVLVELSPCVRTSWINFLSAVTSSSGDRVRD